MQRRDKRTVFKHTLLNILALSKIDERLDKRETADDLLTQRIEFRSRLSLQKTPNRTGQKNWHCALGFGVSREDGVPTPATRSAARR